MKTLNFLLSMITGLNLSATYMIAWNNIGAIEFNISTISYVQAFVINFLWTMLNISKSKVSDLNTTTEDDTKILIIINVGAWFVLGIGYIIYKIIK